MADPLTELIKIAVREVLAESNSKPKKVVATRWPELMDIETAAEYMSRSPDGIRLLIKKKLLPITKIDTRVQIRRIDIDRLIERRTA